MKIRCDFVTNSSSSSFIVSASPAVTIPKEFKSAFDKLTTVDEVIEALDKNYETYQIFGNMSEKEIRQKYGLTTMQIGLIKAASLNKAELYDKIIDMINAGQIVYSIVADWDWNLYCDVKDFIHTLTVLEED